MAPCPIKEPHWHKPQEEAVENKYCGDCRPLYPCKTHEIPKPPDEIEIPEQVRAYYQRIEQTNGSIFLDVLNELIRWAHYQEKKKDQIEAAEQRGYERGFKDGR